MKEILKSTQHLQNKDVQFTTQPGTDLLSKLLVSSDVIAQHEESGVISSPVEMIC